MVLWKRHDWYIPVICVLFAICVCVVLRTEPRTLCLLGQCFTTELYLYPELCNIQEVKYDNHKFETRLGSIMRCCLFACFLKSLLKSSQGITWCSTMLRASAIWRMFFVWFLRHTEAQARMIHSFQPLAWEALYCIGYVSQALSFKAWMNLRRLPAFLSLWPCSQNELWICRHPAPPSQFWNSRNSENKFFHRFLPSDLSLCEAA